MSELISRENEFLKLNEHLDMLASGALDKHPLQQKQHQPTSSVTSASTSKGDPRFCTYTKNKGAPLKKRGAGDGIPDPKKEKSPAMSITHRSNTSSAREAPRLTGRCKVTTPPTPPTTPQMTATTTTINSINGSNMLYATTPPREMSAISTVTTARNKSVIPTPPSTQRCRNTKPPEPTTRICSSRASTNRGSSGGVFTVHYRNPKFIESPSLEGLLREESASIRRRNSPSTTSRTTDVDSLYSGIIVDPGSSGGCGSTTRRSTQASTRKNISTDGLIKFLKSKVAILEDDHDRISQEMMHQKELLENTLERQKKVEQQRDQAYAKHSSLSEQLAKVESQLEDTNRRVKERSLDQSAQQKEVELVKREVKVLAQSNNNLEKRLLRANDDLDSAKNALSMLRAAEREQREAMRSECEARDKQIKSLKKQRADLLNAYKKQLFLIDNLKRQNVCMEQSKMVNFNEKEFTKVLEWNSNT